MIISEGYSNWKHIQKMTAEHETSSVHLDVMVLFCNLRKKRGIDASLLAEIEEQVEYWRRVLHRVVEVIRFIAVRGLALRGDNEIIGSSQNGNFLGLIELIAKFDAFTEGHLKKYGNTGRGSTSYLSSTIVEEIAQLMADKVMDTILNELKEAKYYSISVDSTSDVSHVDQLAFTIRYFTKYGTAIERFLTFLPVADHHSEALANEVLEFLQAKDIAISDCRGQCYDNAANMAGRYNGLQAKIKEINRLAKFTPCTAHSLNLIGEATAKVAVIYNMIL